MWRWFEHSQVYLPETVLEAGPGALGRPAEDVWLATSDGPRLNGWFFPAAAGSARAHLALLALHGNAGNISHRLDYYAAWLSLGVSVLAFDYRGYGRSEGEPGEEGTYLDAQAAHAWLRARGFAPASIVALGKSLGGGVAAELAVREPLGGLILQNTFTSIADLGAEWFPWLPVRRMNTIKYDTVAKLPRIRVPVLIVHSREDELIRFRHAERNFAAAHEPKRLWETRGDHNGTLGADRTRYLEGLEQFLSRLFPTSPNPARA